MIFSLLVICGLTGSIQWTVHASTPRGHLQPFGSHADPSYIIDELDYAPNSLEFYENYVKPHKPVVFRGAAKQSRAYHDWTDEYLKNKYGDFQLLLPGWFGAKNRGKLPEVGLGRTTIKQFINTYPSIDNVIVAASLPGPMERDVSIPPFLLCGTFAKGIKEITLMMRTGGYNTPIHKHIVEEFHCAFNGSEEFMFIQPGQKELQHPWSSIDVDSVDLIKYPELQHIKYASIALNKGDCIYIPTGSYYKISSTDHFNSGIVVWFSFFTKSHQFEGTGCDKNDNFMPASDVNITWRYDGYGDLETLHLDTNILRTVLLTSGDEKGRVWLKQFTENLIKGDGEVGVYDNERKQFSDILDPTGRGYVTVKEVKALSIDVLKKIILAFDHTDDSSTLDYEYRLINHEAIINFTRMLASNGPDPGFHSNEFIEQYVNQLGGTRQKAMEILTGLGVGQGELVTMEMVEKNIEKTIEKFRNAKLKIRADRKPWYEHLLKHKEMF